MKRLLKLWWLALPLVFITGSALANYLATQGAGTTYSSVVIGSAPAVHYLANMLCDFVAGVTQCANVNASGQVAITGPVTPGAAWPVRMQDAGGNGISSDARGTERPLSVQILDASGNQITTFGGSSGAVATPPTLPTQATQIGINVGGTFTALTGTGGSLNANITNLNANDQHANNLSAPVVLSNQQMTAAGSPSTTQVMAVQGTTGGTPLNVSGPSSEYPSGAVPLTNSAGTSASASTVTLASSAGHTVFICSLSYRSNATVTVTGNITVAGLISGTANYMHWTAPAGNGIGITEEVFSPCIPASAQNTNIVVTSPTPGAGGGTSLMASGYLAVGNGY